MIMILAMVMTMMKMKIIKTNKQNIDSNDTVGPPAAWALPCTNNNNDDNNNNNKKMTQVHQQPGHFRAPSPGTYHQPPHQVIVIELCFDDHRDQSDHTIDHYSNHGIVMISLYPDPDQSPF